MSSESWRKPFVIILIAESLAMMGFGTSMPILPLYLQELGDFDPATVAWLAGIAQTCGALAMALTAPIWGAMGDKVGRRAMLLRSMFAGAVVLSLMAFVGAAWQLIVLRTIQGMLTGTVSAATVMVATIVPKERAGSSLGLLQTFVWSGNAVGPLLGGLIADFAGYRATFPITGILLLAAGILVLFFVKEHKTPALPPRSASPPAETVAPADSATAAMDQPSPSRESAAPKPPQPGIFASLASVVNDRRYLALLGLVFAVQFAGAIVQPVLALYVQSIVSDLSRVAFTTGLIVGVSSLASALSSALAGPVVDRIGAGRALRICFIGAFVFTLPQVFVNQEWELLLFRTLSTIFAGGAIPAINALIANNTDRSRLGAMYGLSSSVTSAGMAGGPLVGSLVASTLGFAAAFAAPAVLFGILAVSMTLFLRRNAKKTDGPTPPAQPDPEE